MDDQEDNSHFCFWGLPTNYNQNQLPRTSESSLVYVRYTFNIFTLVACTWAWLFTGAVSELRTI
jgi:hypothetical protein